MFSAKSPHAAPLAGASNRNRSNSQPTPYNGSLRDSSVSNRLRLRQCCGRVRAPAVAVRVAVENDEIRSADRDLRRLHPHRFHRLGERGRRSVCVDVGEADVRREASAESGMFPYIPYRGRSDARAGPRAVTATACNGSGEATRTRAPPTHRCALPGLQTGRRTW